MLPVINGMNNCHHLFANWTFAQETNLPLFPTRQWISHQVWFQIIFRVQDLGWSSKNRPHTTPNIMEVYHKEFSLIFNRSKVDRRDTQREDGRGLFLLEEESHCRMHFYITLAQYTFILNCQGDEATELRLSKCWRVALWFSPLSLFSIAENNDAWFYTVWVPILVFDRQ